MAVAIKKVPPYSSIAIANWFIRNLKPVTPLKLQKLIYYAHGWHLALRDNPLIDELVEAWEFGPVIPSVYHEFKDFGNRPITTFGTEFDILPDTAPEDRVIFVTPQVPKEDSDTTSLLKKIAEQYGKYSGSQLSTMTHQPGTPWFEIHKQNPLRKGVDIPDDEIKNYFCKFVKKKSDGRRAPIA
jgi:uncharacterized phage-associated protein